MTDTTYIDTRDVAKMIRKKLKATFKGVKFSIKMQRYSGGSSINVSWTDGPTDTMVSAITGGYQGAGFDGMIDMAYSSDAWLLADGYTMQFAGTKGTGDQRGSVPALDSAAPEAGAKRVSTTCYVFTNRKESPAVVKRALERVTAKYAPEGIENVHVGVSDYDGSGIIEGDTYSVNINAPMMYGNSISDVVRQEAAKYVPAEFVAAQ